MGANVSTQVATATTTLTNVQKVGCKNDAQIDQSIGNINVNLVGAKCGNIEFTNQANINQICDLSGSAQALANSAQQLSAAQKAALSLSVNVSTGVQENTTTIQQVLEQKCGNAAAINQTIKGANITLQPYVGPDGTVIPASCDVLKFANSASAQNQCILKAVSDALGKTENVQQATQAQESITGFLTALLAAPLMLLLLPAIGIGIIIFIIIIARMLRKPEAPADLSKFGQGAAATGASAGKIGATTTTSAGKPGSTSTNYGALASQGLGFLSSFGKKKGGGSKYMNFSSINLNNVPIVVFAILMLVWYAKTTEPQELQN